MLNEQEKFDIKIFFCYVNIAIFVLWSFFSESPCTIASWHLFLCVLYHSAE